MCKCCKRKKKNEQETRHVVLLVCGKGELGQLGLGTEQTALVKTTPFPNLNIKRLKDVQAGSLHSVVLTTNGMVYTFGDNMHGALGRVTLKEEQCFTPGKVFLPSPAIKISCGSSHSAALLQSGQVYIWGSFLTKNGYLKFSEKLSKTTPFCVLPHNYTVDISSGYHHIVMLTIFGKVFVYGSGDEGQLGRSTMETLDQNVLLPPVEIYGFAFLATKKIWTTAYSSFLEETDFGKICVFGRNSHCQMGISQFNPKRIYFPIGTHLSNVRSIAGGPDHSLLLTNDQRVFVSGLTSYGRLGLADLEEAETTKCLTVLEALQKKEVFDVKCGPQCSHAITANGHLFSWGSGANFVLGTGSEEEVPTPFLMNSKAFKNTRFIKVSSGMYHTLYIAEVNLKNLRKAELAIKRQAEKIDRKSVTKTE